MEPVTEIMTRDPLKVRIDDPVSEALTLLRRHGIRHLPVVDREGALAGLVTDFALALADPEAHAFTAMVPVVGCGQETSIPLALAALRSTTADAIVVTDKSHHPIGILTEHDAVRLAPAMLEGTKLAIRRPGRAFVTISRDDTLEEAFDRMVEHQIRHLPVLDDEVVIGIVSLRDLLGAGAARGAKGTVGEMLHGNEVHVCIEGLPLSEVATRLAKFHVGCLPILDFAHRPVGIVTRSDIIELAIEAEAGHENLPEVWSSLGV